MNLELLKMMTIKNTKKFLSKLLPEGRVKELIKLGFYNWFYTGKYQFSISKSGTYQTNVHGMIINTAEALYHIAPDFDYYQALL